MALAVDKDYASYQDIREEAGQQSVTKLESLTGVVNDSNAVFYVKRTYVVDRNYNDTLDVATVAGDVLVYDDNVAVEVSAIDPTTGAITLASAPASGSVMLATYAHSALSSDLVDKRRKEAIAWAKRKMTGVIDYTIFTDSDLPEELKTFTRLYAAALILIRDQGLNADTDETSKDGYKKLATAKKILMDYIEEIAGSAGSTARASVSTKSDGNLFARNTDLSSYNESVDTTDQFMRG